MESTNSGLELRRFSDGWDLRTVRQGIKMQFYRDCIQQVREGRDISSSTEQAYLDGTSGVWYHACA